MYYSVQASLCKHLIAEDAVPVGDSQLAGQDQRFSVIPVIDYLLEVVLLLAFETFHSEVIYDEQVQMLDLFKELEFVTQYKSILGYSIYQNGEVKFRKDSDYLYSIKSHWEKFKELEPEIEIPEPKAIEIGEAYGYRQFVSPLLIKIPFSVGLNDHLINEDGTNREQE